MLIPSLLNDSHATYYIPVEVGAKEDGILCSYLDRRGGPFHTRAGGLSDFGWDATSLWFSPVGPPRIMSCRFVMAHVGLGVVVYVNCPLSSCSGCYIKKDDAPVPMNQPELHLHVKHLSCAAYSSDGHLPGYPVLAYRFGAHSSANTFGFRFQTKLEIRGRDI
jgi:hypothetical protein